MNYPIYHFSKHLYNFLMILNMCHLFFFILEYFEPNIEFNSTYVHMGERNFRRTEVSPKRVFSVFSQYLKAFPYLVDMV